MANVISQQAPPPPGLPAMNERRALCSHTTMERVFNTAQHTVLCQGCDESDFGWIYVCTEDRTCSASNDHSTQNSTSEPKGEDEVELNSWVARAIEDGQYTDDQIKTLLSQRSNVQKLIANGNQPARPRNSSEAKSTTTKNLAALMSEEPHFFAEKIEHMRKMLRTNREEGAPATPCRLQLCHYCFPSGSERTWLSLNEVCSDTYPKDNFPSHISQIPGSEIKCVRRARSETGDGTEDLDVKATDTVSLSESLNAKRDHDFDKDVDEQQSVSTNDSSDTQSASSDRETLLATFKNYRKQQLGTPRKISKNSGSFSPSNENVPPGQTQSRSVQNTKRGQEPGMEPGNEDGRMKPAKRESAGLEDGDIITQT